MTVEAGKLRHRVVVQYNAPTQDTTSGELVDNWLALATLWASVEPLSVRDFINAGAVQSRVDARIVLRYRADITPDMRVVHGSNTYKIAGKMPDPDSGTEYLTLAVSRLTPSEF